MPVEHFILYGKGSHFQFKVMHFSSEAMKIRTLTAFFSIKTRRYIETVSRIAVVISVLNESLVHQLKMTSK